MKYKNKAKTIVNTSLPMYSSSVVLTDALLLNVLTSDGSVTEHQATLV